jgi:hypothetical protein
MLWGLESCDLGARSPEPPPDQEVPLVNLSDPDSTLLQLQIGLQSGIITQYMNAFAPDFVFHPDDQDSIELVNATGNPELFDDWNVDVERQVALLLFQQTTVRDVAFANAESTPTLPNVVHLEEDYDLQIDTTLFQGRAFLDLRQDSGEWRIIFWKDNRQAGSPNRTWGFLRGDTR